MMGMFICEQCGSCIATHIAWIPNMAGGFDCYPLCNCPECKMGGGGAAVLKKLLEGTAPVYREM